MRPFKATFTEIKVTTLAPIIWFCFSFSLPLSDRLTAVGSQRRGRQSSGGAPCVGVDMSLTPRCAPAPRLAQTLQTWRIKAATQLTARWATSNVNVGKQAARKKAQRSFGSVERAEAPSEASSREPRAAAAQQRR